MLRSLLWSRVAFSSQELGMEKGPIDGVEEVHMSFPRLGLHAHEVCQVLGDLIRREPSAPEDCWPSTMPSSRRPLPEKACSVPMRHSGKCVQALLRIGSAA